MESVSGIAHYDLVVHQLDDSLAVRLPEKIAKAAGLTAGLPVKVEVVYGGLLIRPIRDPELTLHQMLQRFDPVKHEGEVMATTPVGRETL